MPVKVALSQFFYRRITGLTENGELEIGEKTDALRRLVLEIFEKVAEPDRLHFSTNYARISYVAHKHSLPKQLVYREREFRRGRIDRLPTEDRQRHLDMGYRVALELVSHLFENPAPASLAHLLEAPYPTGYRKPEVRKIYYQLRVLAVEVDTEEEVLYVSDEERSELLYGIPYGEAELRESQVAHAVAILRDVSGPYVTLNLLRAELREGNRMYPLQIVIEPDFLVNVTDVAGAFQGRGNYQPWSSLSKRLLPFEQTVPLTRGNIVNSFLDVLIHDPEVTFQSLLPGIFSMQPLALCLYDDKQVRQLVTELKHHFLTVKKVVREELGKLNIDRETVMLEPSFLSPAYGLQGRLDLLQSERDTEDGLTSIIELKTSKIYAPNTHGIKHDNFIQTLLYDLMINRALGKDANVRSYILYSIDFDRPIRYAPPESTQQMEALTARNQLVAVEMLIANLGLAGTEDLREQTDRLTGRLHPARFRNLGKFAQRDHDAVLSVYGELDDLERRYFGAFLGFTAREQRLSKIGEQKVEKVNGLASLWLDERQDKVDRFELLDGLTFRRYDVRKNILTLAKRPGTDTLVKFRQGDIIALYTTPTDEARRGDTVRSQIFKSTIVSLEADSVRVRPRNPQLNDSVFRRAPYWSIEKDVLDSGFRNYYQGLFTWAGAGKDLRDRWLGRLPPGQSAPYPDLIGRELTDEQDNILRRIVTAPDYFLLWGPPGTGKTSQMLHHLVRHLLYRTEEDILLIAYTNRAVDEICESIERIQWEGENFRNYLRIGSRYGAAPRFEDRLLQVRSASVKKRSELRELITGTRVIVGTVASVGGKGELFQLKQFDRIVVDEASQILEPLLAGILPRAPRTLLIGDHRQLPAVVQQQPAETRVYDTALRDAGLTSLATSLFERLYLTARREGWSWAYDQLRHQGRMHADIMAFPALHFYQGNLDILPDTIAHRATQLAPLRPSTSGEELGSLIGQHRLFFVPTGIDHGSADPKVNRHEATMLLRLINAFEVHYADSDRPVQAGDIGIITPYRAQIAHVREQLILAGLNPEHYTVDTVERYQGSAKRIVLLSVCANETYQMASLSQLSEEGVDRKLNVAMTRAREHLVLVGCPEVLRESEVYKSLLDFLKEPHP